MTGRQILGLCIALTVAVTMFVTCVKAWGMKDTLIAWGINVLAPAALVAGIMMMILG